MGQVEFKEAINLLKEQLSSDVYSSEINVRGLKCRELNAPLHLKLNPKSQNLILDGNFKTNLEYAQREFEWYFSGRNDTKYISSVAPFWESISNNGISNSAYGQWAFGQNQFERVINELKKDKSSRRAIIYFASNENYFEKDVICTSTIQFMIRNGKIDCHVNMRSNDFYLGFRNDTIMFMAFQELASIRLGVPIGNYYLNATSFHIYEKDYHRLKIEDFQTKRLTFIEMLHSCKDDEMTKKIVETTKLKNSKIIIEGPDEIGKTTFVNKISSPEHEKYGFGSSYDYFKQLFSNEYFICDRGILSEMVYSKIFNRHSDINYDNINELLSGISQYLFVPKNYGDYLKFLKLKHKDDKKIIEDAHDILLFFKKIALELDIEIIEVDTNAYIDDLQ